VDVLRMSGMRLIIPYTIIMTRGGVAVSLADIRVSWYAVEGVEVMRLLFSALLAQREL
jgi:hypothetical protein